MVNDLSKKDDERYDLFFFLIKSQSFFCNDATLIVGDRMANVGK